GQNFTGTEHLLVGTMIERENFGVLVLKNLGVGVDQPREMFESLVPVSAPSSKPREAPLTEAARKVLQLAQEQAIGMGHQYIGCETLLLGLLLEPSGLAHEILQKLGVTYETARA